MNVILENWLVIVHGLRMTLALAGAVLICTTLISLVLGVLATLPNRALRWIIHGYVELFRSIPLIVNVFCVFFVAPMFGLDLSPFLAATVGLSLWGGANGTVVVSGGILSVASHQWKSAAALGLRRWQIYRYVIGPQSVSAILPAYTGLLTLLVQSTSLGALIGGAIAVPLTSPLLDRGWLRHLRFACTATCIGAWANRIDTARHIGHRIGRPNDRFTGEWPPCWQGRSARLPDAARPM